MSRSAQNIRRSFVSNSDLPSTFSLSLSNSIFFSCINDNITFILLLVSVCLADVCQSVANRKRSALDIWNSQGWTSVVFIFHVCGIVTLGLLNRITSPALICVDTIILLEINLTDSHHSSATFIAMETDDPFCKSLTRTESLILLWRTSTSQRSDLGWSCLFTIERWLRLGLSIAEKHQDSRFGERKSEMLLTTLKRNKTTLVRKPSMSNCSNNNLELQINQTNRKTDMHDGWSNTWITIKYESI